MKKLSNRVLMMISVLALAALWLPREAMASCVSSSRGAEQSSNNNIKVRWVGNVPNNVKNAVRSGMNAWNSSSCNPEGAFGAPSEFPKFIENGGSNFDPIIRINYVDAVSSDNPQRCGSFAGLDITLYSKARRENGSIFRCDQAAVLADTAAHEFGHRLGLNDQAGSSCGGYIMSQVQVTANGTYIQRNIKASECQKVQSTHATPDEAQAEEDHCSTSGTSCHDGDYDYCSPIVIPLTADQGLEFTSPEEGVWFDLDGGGLDRVGWTPAGAPLALLWRDLNHNDIVDDGSELFGSVTPKLSGGVAFMGYEALADFDAEEFGGNGNGWADTGDAHWNDLLLWVDVNHDGVSQRAEILTTRRAGLYAIQILADHSFDKDAHGNWLKWSAPAYIERRGTGFVAGTADVFFVHGHHED